MTGIRTIFEAFEVPYFIDSISTCRSELVMFACLLDIRVECRLHFLHNFSTQQYFLCMHI